MTPSMAARATTRWWALDGGGGTNDVFYTQGNQIDQNPNDVLLLDLQYNAFHQFQSTEELQQ
jgi:hypothetical protein